jgi:serine/threonine-protein kinase RsbT
VQSQVDVDRARRLTRELSLTHGLGAVDTERVALATVELATNLVRYAHGGELVLRVIQSSSGEQGIEIESRDDGPGIVDVEEAMQDGFSTGGGLGGGLASVRRLMDEFVLTSAPTGTRIVARKWPTRAHSG